MTEHLVTKTIECFDQLLMETATIKVDKIILVGGQSKCHSYERITELVWQKIDFSTLQMAVALGGALMAEAIVHQQRKSANVLLG